MGTPLKRLKISLENLIPIANNTHVDDLKVPWRFDANLYFQSTGPSLNNKNKNVLRKLNNIQEKRILRSSSGSKSEPDSFECELEKEEVIVKVDEDDIKIENGIKNKSKVISQKNLLKLIQEKDSFIQNESIMGKRRSLDAHLKEDVSILETENNNLCENKLVDEKTPTLEEKKVDLPIQEIKKEVDQFNLGDLCWARIGTFPFWPCIISNETKGNVFQRHIIRKKYKAVTQYHVRFFGDNGRRSWIFQHNLIPYTNKEDLEVRKTKNKNDGFTVPPKQVPKWTNAVNEVELLKNLEPEERLREFDAIVEAINIAKKEESLLKRTQKVKRRSSMLQDEKLVKKPKIEIENDVLNQNFIDDEKLFKMKIENEEISLKKEVDLIISPTMEYLTELYSKNNLFYKKIRERVCVICMERKNIVKCNGKCGWQYHIECDKQENTLKIKEEPVDCDFVEIKQENMSINEQIDYKMRELMKDSLSQTFYPDTEDCIEITQKTNRKKKVKRHVCADSSFNEYFDEDITIKQEHIIDDFKCKMCTINFEPDCFICHKQISFSGIFEKIKCSLNTCTRYYHLKCLKLWPQTQFRGRILDKDTSFICPCHVCHTCISENPDQNASRCSDKFIRCLRCPASYHASDYCVPAGTQILNTSQIICPRHYGENKTTKPRKIQSTINTTWCFLCSRGGNLVCCETCPTSVHSSCLPINLTEDDRFICEDCESGRFPLYGEIVWAKLGKYRWWPAVIPFPHEIPSNVNNILHNDGEFVVKFFGTYNYYWVSRCRTFLFQEGDKGVASHRKRVDTVFIDAVNEATSAYYLRKQFKASKSYEFTISLKLKPPPYIRIKNNKPVGDVKHSDMNFSNTTACDCNPNDENPCGPYSNCLNRLLMTECNPEICPCGEKCKNQRFEKREYPDLVPYKTHGRGWGLKTLVDLVCGQFIIEYVGEMIDEREYQRRIQIMHENKVENYYFLTIDKDRMLDAGPKGNVARFINHSCEPNCETQKWTVNGDTRIGLFAIEDIPAGTELTFNYNLECIGKEKKVCKCGAKKCSGYIGVKIKSEEIEIKKSIKPTKTKKKRVSLKTEPIKLMPTCFICGENQDCIQCTKNLCKRYYHLKCCNVSDDVPVNKFICPAHNCNICTKRTTRSCLYCLNSYCPEHSDGNIRYDKKYFGFLCKEHDQVEEFSNTALELRENGDQSKIN